MTTVQWRTSFWELTYVMRLYVSILQTYATYNWRTINPIDFKLGTLIIKIKMIPIARQVSG